MEKIGSLRRGLDQYNQYLQRRIKLQIYDITTIYVKICSLPTEQQIEAIQYIANSFKEGELSPMRYLSWFSDLQDKNQFLTKKIEEPLLTTINKTTKDFAIVLASIIPAAVTLAQFIIPH